MPTAKDFFTLQQQDALKQAIIDAEDNTSGEIRLHIDNKCPGEPMQKAVDVFAILKMQKTELRNGVLFYLAVQDRKFAILGDAGIHAVVPDNFWDNIKSEMQSYFKEEKFTEGLCIAIGKAGEQLKKHFPYKQNDVNELKDEVSFGK
ncbi:MAG: TPM domain-containing protein [Bacteroidetes bacterium]|nr:TPM domain-containing protein [Bacteroidota bacterium]